jgi:hypothetical protein
MARNRAWVRGCLTAVGVWLILASCSLALVLVTGYLSGILPISAPSLGLETRADAQVDLPADFYRSLGGLATLVSMLLFCATPALALVVGVLASRVFRRGEGG